MSDGEPDKSHKALEVLDQFVQISKSRLSQKAGDKYEKVINELKTLVGNNSELEDMEAKELIPFLPLFLSCHMVKFVKGVSKKDIQAAATVMKNLFMWMKHNQFIPDTAGDIIVHETKELSKELGEAEDLFRAIQKFAPAPDHMHTRDVVGDKAAPVDIFREMQFLNKHPFATGGPPCVRHRWPPGTSNNRMQGLFEVCYVLPGTLCLHDISNVLITVSVDVPAEVSNMCRKKWVLEAVLSHDKNDRWKFKEIWSVDTSLPYLTIPGQYKMSIGV